MTFQSPPLPTTPSLIAPVRNSAQSYQQEIFSWRDERCRPVVERSRRQGHSDSRRRASLLVNVKICIQAVSSGVRAMIANQISF